ncbi:MAG: cardiolipin synthase [Christensenellaceae bacterium]|nr:cardiolipin synthase [Christensenellaceae bacterium]
MRVIASFLRLISVAIAIIVQIIVLLFMILFMQQFVWFYILSEIIAVIAFLSIINRDDKPEYKIAWLIPLLVFPIFGALLFVLFAKNNTNEHFRMQQKEYNESFCKAISGTESKFSELIDTSAQKQAHYLQNHAHAPLYSNTSVEYFPIGEAMFDSMLKELKNAKKFIFLEFFIIKFGLMWDSILEILEQKVAEGLDIRVIYDDFGSLFHLPNFYFKDLEAKGIKACVFNRFKPSLSGSFNNRDHRKIMVIDGNVAYTGGINIADEYINHIEVHGHWLDSGVILKGEAVWSFTLMFLSMWDYLYNTKSDINAFATDKNDFLNIKSKGFVQPFSDVPLDGENIGEGAYYNIISRAKEYVYICTPYLIIDNALMLALSNCAKSGVDVRIITPGIGDKWYVHATTRSYYKSLIKAGVRIYEYTPGFIHSKTVVCDGDMALCGTINFDFRSLYLHYECGVCLYDNKAVMQIYDSFIDTLFKCTEQNLDNIKVPWYKELIRAILKMFAPLM